MPFPRPTLTQLKQQAAQDIASSLQGVDALLRFSNLNIIGTTVANFANLQYGYLDYIAQQSNPFTATDEALEAWAALKGVYRKPATPASGQITVTGTPGVTVPSGTAYSRSDSVPYVSTASITISSLGSALVPLTAVPDPSGMTGANTDTPIGSTFAISNAIPGLSSSAVCSTAFVGGADVETDAALRTRMLAAYQTPVGIGGPQQYVNEALAVPGVTRAWALRNGRGTGTVIVYTMFDMSESAFGGFPQGTNGVSSSETRDTVAAGDQLLVANAIFPNQPVGPIVYSYAPAQQVVNFSIAGISSPSSALTAAVTAALNDTFLRVASPLGMTLNLQDIENAVQSVSGTTGFYLVTPAANVVVAVGSLPVVGTVVLST